MKENNIILEYFNIMKKEQISIRIQELKLLLINQKQKNWMMAMKIYERKQVVELLLMEPIHMQSLYKLMMDGEIKEFG